MSPASRDRNRPAPRSTRVVVAAALALPLVAATCRRAEAPGASADAAAAPGLPGVDLSALPEAAQKQLLQVATDEFCSCGCPHTLAGCLREHATCRHAPQMAQLAAELAGAGDRAFEIIRTLGGYYRSFKSSNRRSADLGAVACKGPPTAAVTVVEYADFECPSCGAAKPILDELFTRSDGRVRLCFKNYPLSAHPHALTAAQAAEHAREKGKFWEMHDLLFSHQDALGIENMGDYAARVGLDGKELERAILSGKHLPAVNASREEGRAAGVEATPSLFLNGRPLSLPISIGFLRHALQDEVEWLENNRWRAD